MRNDTHTLDTPMKSTSKVEVISDDIGQFVSAVCSDISNGNAFHFRAYNREFSTNESQQWRQSSWQG